MQECMHAETINPISNQDYQIQKIIYHKSEIKFITPSPVFPVLNFLAMDP
jgi:hypothetical protein